MSPARRSAVRMSVVVALIITGAFIVGQRGTGGFHSKPLSVRPAADIRGTDAAGGPFVLSALAGKVVVLTFGFTSCPDICPLTLTRARALLDALGEDAASVEVVFLTVDPERDTPERLARYVTAFHPRIHAVALPPVQLRQTLALYSAVAERREAEGGYYNFDHTSGFLLIDRVGRLRAHAPHALEVDELAADVRRLLSEAPPPATDRLRVEAARAQVGPTGIGAAYLTVVNPTDLADRLLRVETEDADRVELHESREEAGVAKMVHRKEGFAIPGGGRLPLSPGGAHVMLYGVPHDLTQAALVLHFERSAPVRVQVAVDRPGQ